MRPPPSSYRTATRPCRPADPVELVAQIGGLEIAAIAGLVIGGAAARVPVVVDGVVTLAGALVATALVPAAAGYLVAGHRSTEPGASAALEHLGLDPLLDLGLRLGEGTGGCLALPLLRAAARSSARWRPSEMPASPLSTAEGRPPAGEQGHRTSEQDGQVPRPQEQV